MLKESPRSSQFRAGLLFWIVLLLYYVLLDFQHILFLDPQGIHFIRQTDSLSFAANYYRHGMHFFTPEVYNLASIGGKAACEFPVLYYLTALLYFPFGEQAYILRLITLTIASIGFYHLFLICKKWLNDLWTAIAFSFLIISSTVLLYYSNNFLPDASAFGLTLIGWYYFLEFRLKDTRRNLILAFFFLTTASLIKVTYFLHPVAMAVSYVLPSISLIKNQSYKQTQIRFTLLLFILSFLVVISWNSYAIYYNHINKDYYFLTNAFPIWSMSASSISETWDFIINYWHTKYYYPTTLHFLCVLFIAGVMLIQKVRHELFLPCLFTVAGTLGYFLLFFGQFKDHDYYFITLIPGIFIFSLTALATLRSRFPSMSNHWVIKAGLTLLTLLSMFYAQRNVTKRYLEKDEKFAIITEELKGVRELLDNMQVPSTAKFIIAYDRTPNGGLWGIGRSGWNIRDTVNSITTLHEFVTQGAEYIIYTDKNVAIPPVHSTLVGETDHAAVYKITVVP